MTLADVHQICWRPIAGAFGSVEIRINRPGYDGFTIANSLVFSHSPILESDVPLSKKYQTTQSRTALDAVQLVFRDRTDYAGTVDGTTPLAENFASTNSTVLSQWFQDSGSYKMYLKYKDAKTGAEDAFFAGFIDPTYDPESDPQVTRANTTTQTWVASRSVQAVSIGSLLTSKKWLDVLKLISASDCIEGQFYNGYMVSPPNAEGFTNTHGSVFGGTIWDSNNGRYYQAIPHVHQFSATNWLLTSALQGGTGSGSGRWPSSPWTSQSGWWGPTSTFGISFDTLLKKITAALGFATFNYATDMTVAMGFWKQKPDNTNKNYPIDTSGAVPFQDIYFCFNVLAKSHPFDGTYWDNPIGFSPDQPLSDVLDSLFLIMMSRYSVKPSLTGADTLIGTRMDYSSGSLPSSWVAMGSASKEEPTNSARQVTVNNAGDRLKILAPVGVAGDSVSRETRFRLRRWAPTGNTSALNGRIDSDAMTWDASLDLQWQADKAFKIAWRDAGGNPQVNNDCWIGLSAMYYYNASNTNVAYGSNWDPFGGEAGHTWANSFYALSAVYPLGSTPAADLQAEALGAEYFNTRSLFACALSKILLSLNTIVTYEYAGIASDAGNISDVDVGLVASWLEDRAVRYWKLIDVGSTIIAGKTKTKWQSVSGASSQVPFITDIPFAPVGDTTGTTSSSSGSTNSNNGQNPVATNAVLQFPSNASINTITSNGDFQELTIKASSGQTANWFELQNSSGTVYVKVDASGNLVLTTPLAVASGGTGRNSIPAHQVMIGNSTSAVTVIALADGQTLIGNTGTSPSAATLTAGDNISVTNGAGSITIAATGLLSEVNIDATALGISSANGLLGTVETITLSGPVSIAGGGTNASTANDALNNLLPAQGPHPGKFLYTNGANPSWEVAGSGTLTSIATGSGLTGGPITSAGTISFDYAANNVWTVAQEVDRNGIGVTATTAFALGNTTAATSGLNQWSPRFVFSGNSWNGSASANVSWALQNQTTTGAGAVAGSTFALTMSRGGGSYYPQITYTSGSAGTNSTLTIGDYTNTFGANLSLGGTIPSGSANDAYIFGQNTLSGVGGSLGIYAGRGTSGGGGIYFRGGTISAPNNIVVMNPNGLTTFGNIGSTTAILALSHASNSNVANITLAPHAASRTYTLTDEGAAANLVVARSSLSRYQLVTGTATTAGVASLGSTGIPGDVLVSTGAGALPFWQAAHCAMCGGGLIGAPTQWYAAGATIAVAGQTLQIFPAFTPTNTYTIADAFAVMVDVPPGLGNNVVFTLYDGTSATGATVTISGVSTSGVYSGSAVGLSNSFLSVKAVSSVGSATGAASWTLNIH